MIQADRLMMLFAEAILHECPGATVVFDVKFSRNLQTVIEAAGGQAIMARTGHSMIKQRMRDTGAMLAGEMSGHIFFKHRWFGFDDAIYAGVRLLEILSNTSETVHDVFTSLPQSINTPELKVYVDDQRKFTFMQELMRRADFGNARVVTIDGLRVEFPSGWGLIRPSNTTPNLVLRFEADSDEAMSAIQQQFREQILKVEPELNLPF